MVKMMTMTLQVNGGREKKPIRWAFFLTENFLTPGFSVENAFLDEKEEAILALKQIAEHTG